MYHDIFIVASVLGHVNSPCPFNEGAAMVRKARSKYLFFCSIMSRRAEPPSARMPATILINVLTLLRFLLLMPLTLLPYAADASTCVVIMLRARHPPLAQAAILAALFLASLTLSLALWYHLLLPAAKNTQHSDLLVSLHLVIGLTAALL